MQRFFCFLKKFTYACRINRCFRYNKSYPALPEDKNSRILQFFCYDYFEDRLGPITFAKNFGFLAGVVSKIFSIENAAYNKTPKLINVVVT